MKKVAVLAALIAVYCAACAKPVRFPGAYDRHNRVYVNDTIGFRLLFPRYWAVTSDPRHFTVPVFLRADQEQLLEAYDLASRLGLVVVAQEVIVQPTIKSIVDALQPVAPNRALQGGIRKLL